MGYRGTDRAHGYHCGSKQSAGFTTCSTRATRGSGYFNGDYRLNENAQLYATALYTFSKNTTYAGPDYNFWWPNNFGNYFFNGNTGTFEYL